MTITSEVLPDGSEHRTHENGTQSWWRDGELHREDGPALVVPDTGAFPSAAREEWYRHGKLHRADGPALTTAWGRQEWFVDGKLHRLDGPAVTTVGGDAEWWEHGVRKADRGVSGG